MRLVALPSAAFAAVLLLPITSAPQEVAVEVNDTETAEPAPAGPVCYLSYVGVFCIPSLAAASVAAVPLPARTVPHEAAAPVRAAGKVCDPSYVGVCIPPPPPDLDCGNVPHRGFRVVGADPHRFDQDKDGIGCEGT